MSALQQHVYSQKSIIPGASASWAPKSIERPEQALFPELKTHMSWP